MQRREFIALLGSAAAWPLAAHAQQGGRMRRIGVLLGIAEDEQLGKAQLAGFREGLEKRGWSEGRNIRIDYRFAPENNTEQEKLLAKELIALQPDAVLAHSTGVTAAVQRESRTIPIVFVAVSDPVGSGFVASLARPGGNITGFLLYEAGIPGKWLASLKEIAPRLARAAFVASPKSAVYNYFLRAAETAAALLAIDLVPTPIESAADIERAIESFARLPNSALVVPPNNTNRQHRDLIVALAAQYHLPAVYSSRDFVAAGGLMSYDTDLVDQFRQASSYVDRILRGEKPADLPVQAPSKYELVLNLKTAKTLGLTFPETLLATADEVIQ